MENTTGSIESLIEKIKNYVETNVNLLKLKAIDKSSTFVSIIIDYLIAFLVFGIFIILLNIGLALLIGEWLGEVYYGFFIMAVLNVIVGLLLIKNTKWIKAPLANTMIKKLLD
jgi:hypothetical protein